MSIAGRLGVLVFLLMGVAGCGNDEPRKPPAPGPQVAALPASKPVVRPWTMGQLPPDQVNLIAIGDWGSHDQQQVIVAHALADYVEKTGVQFHALYTTGDNFCQKIFGIDDPRWQTTFEDLYDPRRLAMPFYMALGNHDYDQGPLQAEMDYSPANPTSRWKLPARWYRVDLPQDNPLVTVLVLDSNAQYMTKADWSTQMRWMDEELSKPQRGRWTICIGHHPFFSNGSYGDNPWLTEAWGPLFQKHKVDFYICGHSHGLEHLQVPGYYSSFLISGGGGRGVQPMVRGIPGPFSEAMYGFAHLQLRADEALVRFVNESGRDIHRFRRSSVGKITIETTTPKP